MVETARSLFSTFTPVFEMKKVESHFTSNVDSFICFQDKDKIIKIFGNLISNAVKNVEDSGLVKFTLDIGRNKLKVTIFNSGSFIPKSQYKSIFQSFFETSKKGNRHSGIGLTLVSEIVRKLGGSLNIESKEGVGTSFIVEMPVSCSEDSEESVLDSNISTEEYEYFVDNIMYDLSPYVSEEVEHNTVQTKKYTILLVEDNVDFNNILSEKLALEYSVIQVFDGKRGAKVPVSRHRHAYCGCQFAECDRFPSLPDYQGEWEYCSYPRDPTEQEHFRGGEDSRSGMRR